MHPSYLLGMSRKSAKTPSLSKGVKQTPECCSEHSGILQPSAAVFDIPVTHPSLHSPAWQIPGSPRVPRGFSHWVFSPVHCRNMSCHVSLELARLALIYPLTDPSGPASLCRFHLAYPSSGLRDPKSQQHQGDTPGTVC